MPSPLVLDPTKVQSYVFDVYSEPIEIGGKIYLSIYLIIQSELSIGAMSEWKYVLLLKRCCTVKFSKIITHFCGLQAGGGHNSPNFAWLGLYCSVNFVEKCFHSDWVGIIEYIGFNPKYIYLYGIVWTVNFNIFQQWDIVV